MSDKFRNTYPISISFTAGEMPTNTKLTALSSQAKAGLQWLEYAVGDLWNQAGDYYIEPTGANSKPLMIANIARLLGQSNKLSPLFPYLPSLTRVEFSFKDYSGKREAFLKIKPKTSGSTWTWTGTSTPSDKKTNVTDITATGDYWIDSETGKVVTYDAINADWVLTYEPALVGTANTTSTFNIIPDPDTLTTYAFKGCKVSYFNGTDDSAGYLIFLPPRGPLSRVIDGSIDSNEDQQPQIVDNTTNDINQTSTVTGSARYPWQSDTVDACTDATNAPHYRYTIPQSILNSSNFSAGTSPLPAGLLYLWDWTQTGTIVEGVVFYKATGSPYDTYSSQGWCLFTNSTSFKNWITNNGSTVGYTSAVLADRTTHSSAYYPSNGLRLITVGSSVSELLLELTQAFYLHNHGDMDGLKGRFNTTTIDHSHLKNNFNRSSQSITGISNIDFNSVLITSIKLQDTTSTFINDYHPQYLSREPNATTSRDAYKNGMLTDLLMMGDDGTESNTPNSFRIMFGHHSTGAHIGYEKAHNDRQGGALQALDASLVIRNFPLRLYDRLEILPTIGNRNSYLMMKGRSATGLFGSGNELNITGYIRHDSTDTTNAHFVIEKDINTNNLGKLTCATINAPTRIDAGDLYSTGGAGTLVQSSVKSKQFFGDSTTDPNKSSRRKYVIPFSSISCSPEDPLNTSTSIFYLDTVGDITGGSGSGSDRALKVVNNAVDTVQLACSMILCHRTYYVIEFYVQYAGCSGPINGFWYKIMNENNAPQVGGSFTLSTHATNQGWWQTGATINETIDNYSAYPDPTPPKCVGIELVFPITTAKQVYIRKIEFEYQIVEY